MRLMRALIEHAFDAEPPMLKTIAQEAGMPAAKAHRYMVSLLRCELVGRDAIAGRYTLGPLARLIGLRALQSVDIIRLANLRLPAITARLRQTICLAVWYPGQGATIVSVEEWHEIITIGTRVGRVMSIIDSAVGQVFGAWLPSEETEPLVRMNLEELRRERTRDPSRAFITTAAQVRDLYEAVRQSGVGTSINSVLNPVVKAMAVPVFDHRGVVIGALATLGAADPSSARSDAEVIAELKAAAAEISYELGYTEEINTRSKPPEPRKPECSSPPVSRASRARA